MHWDKPECCEQITQPHFSLGATEFFFLFSFFLIEPDIIFPLLWELVKTLFISPTWCMEQELIHWWECISKCSSFLPSKWAIRLHAPGLPPPYLPGLLSCPLPPDNMILWFIVGLLVGLKHATPAIWQWLLLCPVAQKFLGWIATWSASGLHGLPPHLLVLLPCSTSSPSTCAFKLHATFYLAS